MVYQVYPRSFLDSNGDGIGDLPGIIKKLDYLQWLGIDALWLNPICASPDADNGYDISDYYAIHEDFGTMEDFDRLAAGLHERGIRLILDLVVNHTSDEHPWFSASRSSPEHPMRDFYIWLPGNTDGKDLLPPNNWESFFEGSAWELDPCSREFYLHLFSRKQPDLNWENPKLRSEVYRMMNWWLDKGVDGFRMDVINMISKVPGYPDGTPGASSGILGSEHFINGPLVIEYLREMRQSLHTRKDLLTIGETSDVDADAALTYVNSHDGPLSMLFQIDHMEIDQNEEGYWSCVPWKLADMKRILASWQTGMHGRGWNTLFLNNHDQPRMVSRFGNDREYRKQSAKLLAMMLYTLEGTPFIYQGEEIGMTNAYFDSIEDYRDVWAKNFYARSAAEGTNEQEIMRHIKYRGRDNARTPMQWDQGPCGGFTSGKPWIRVNPNFREINVSQAMDDPDSILHFYRTLIRMRKTHAVLVFGDFPLHAGDHEQLFAYTRTLNDQRADVFLLFSQTPLDIRSLADQKQIPYASGELLLANYDDAEEHPDMLRPYEARVYRSISGSYLTAGNQEK